MFMDKIRYYCFFGGLLICTASTTWADTLQLSYTIRDFSSMHPDMEQGFSGDDRGIVYATISTDKKPIYAGGDGTATTNGQANFDQWYRDVAGINLSSSGMAILDNTITSDPEIYTFYATSFFPVDNRLLGNEGRSRNSHFTYELHSEFLYQGGETLSYTSDDDLWVFINDTLVVDLGGIHSAQTDIVNLDEIAENIGITPGNQYDFDLFFAERQTSESTLRFDIPRNVSQVLRKAENGVGLPPKGQVRVLMTFAEVNFEPCTGNPNKAADNWPEGELPTFKDKLLDHSLTPTEPNGIITDYFHQMSFGEYEVLGDHYPQLLTFDCNSLPTLLDVVNQINSGVNPIISNNGYTLDNFDHWSIPQYSREGAVKEEIADNYVDILMVIWRNYNPLKKLECVSFGGDCVGGFIEGQKNLPLGNKNGFNNAGQFVHFGGDTNEIFLHEYMHTLLGGNNWHIGGGAGSHTVHAPQGTFGMLSQSPAVSNVATGWDRAQLGWQHPSSQQAISVLDGVTEIVSDMSVSSHPYGGTFVLRDSVMFGDALRLKLPHIDWKRLGDNKNQYLWLENHQRLSQFDVNARDTDPCIKKWTPGIYAYIQIGKDTDEEDVNNDGRVDALDIYPSSAVYPNALGSYLFPLTAEGNFDFYYRLDQVEGFTSNDLKACQWNNVSIPTDEALSLPNAFTGYSDVYQRIDIDNVVVSSADPNNVIANPQAPTFIPFANGSLFSGEPKYVLTEFVNGNIIRELPQAGDQQDAFAISTGKTKLSINTNPAPVPIYTNTSSFGFNSPAALTGASYENREIWLNGLSVEILDEILIDSNAATGKEIVVQVRWDDYRIDNDVRWAGNIVLQNDVTDPLERKSRIILSEGKNIFLDRGLSPTQDIANTIFETISFPDDGGSIYPADLIAESGKLFTVATKLIVKPGTKLHLERDSTLWLINGSTLEIATGAEVQLEPGARIETGVGGGNPIFNGIVRQFGDLNDPPDGCVDRGDLNIIINTIRANEDNVFHDLNEDFQVNIADARRLVTFFTNPNGAACSPPAPG